VNEAVVVLQASGCDLAGPLEFAGAAGAVGAVLLEETAEAGFGKLQLPLDSLIVEWHLSRCVREEG
jgi:hypothetical protein